MGRPREHGRETREALLVAAEARLSAGGFDAVAMRAIAADAGVSTRAIYSLFGGKEGLLRALLKRAFDGLTEQLDKVLVTDDPGADLIGLAIDGFRAYALEHPQMFRLTFEELVPGIRLAETDRSVGAGALERLVSRAQRAAEAGVLGGRDARMAAFQWHAAVQGLTSMELSDLMARWGIEPVTFWRDTLRALLAGLAETSASR
jgi:AcrR family transcriptional regulator